ncbi:MAG: ribonuclease D [Methylococcales bacterium]|jgi:ribonuclease D|nr:ribonuclease D [Methylococcales bacterium]MBT7411129.1 ribonuclease D [Methylococcales bacterium]
MASTKGTYTLLNQATIEVKTKQMLIDKTKDLKNFCHLIKGSTFLAIDTEFIREKTYYPILCLIQVSNGKHSACIDTLKIDNLSALNDIIYDKNVTKIFHSGFQDIEILFQKNHKIPFPVFDTQLAAAFDGIGEQIGYADLVYKICNIELDKSQCRTQWDKRPLTQKQIEYAIADVTHLVTLYQSLTQSLDEKNKLEWLIQDLDELFTKDRLLANEVESWKKIHGSNRLSGKHHIAIKNLSLWRENKAKQLNLPRKWVLKNDLILAIAQQMPNNESQLKQINHFSENLVKKYGNEIIQIIDHVNKLENSDDHSMTENFKLSESQSELLNEMAVKIQNISADQKIPSSLLATKKQLRKFISGEKNLNLLKGWRHELFGKEL